MYLYIKAIHIIFVVTWFAGLFYFPRLLIYHTEANAKTETEKSILLPQFELMMRRLWYGITWPSAILTLIFGSWLFYLYPTFETWLQVKVGLVVLLFLYHFSLHRLFKNHQKRVFKYSSQFLRFWNEIATLFLVGIIFLVELKNTLDMLWAVVGMVLLIIVLMVAISVYKKTRLPKKY